MWLEIILFIILVFLLVVWLYVENYNLVSILLGFVGVGINVCFKILV